jgi:hypothetical protein
LEKVVGLSELSQLSPRVTMMDIENVSASSANKVRV